MKVIIAGGRFFNNYELVDETMRQLDLEISEIVCGCAKGADELGAQWAERNQIPIKRFPAYWNNLGRAAGPIRNREMAEYADFLVAFWDGKSRGTKNMIEEMRKLGKHGRVVWYE